MDEARRTKKNLWMFPLGTVGRDMIYTVGLSNILDNELNGGKPMEGFHR